MPSIANALVTATPLTAGYPTLSGYTNSSGQVALALTPSLTYTLTFSGPAVGKVSNFAPSNTTFTLYTVKNKGTLSMSISKQKLSGGKSVYAFHGSVPVKALKPFLSWKPGTLFKKAKASSTSLIMPTSDVSVSYTAKAVVAKLYAVDGKNGSGFLAINHAYDLSTNTWSTKASDTSVRSQPAAGVIASKLYAVDGLVHTTCLTINHAYDPSTNTWSTKASDPAKRSALAAGVIASKLYAVDGYNGAYLANNNAYDPSTNTWSTKASDTQIRYKLAAGVIKSKLYAVDGANPSSLAINHAYDPSTNTWSTKTNDPTVRKGIAAGVIG